MSPAVSRALSLARAGASLYAAAGATGASYPALCRAAKRAGIVAQHDHCTACGSTAHRAKGASCSPSYLAALDVVDRGLTYAQAAKARGVDSSSVYAAVKREFRRRMLAKEPG